MVISSDLPPVQGGMLGAALGTILLPSLAKYHASGQFDEYSRLLDWGLRLTLLLTKDIREVLKMVRLMVFNVRSGNKDDHSKNFSFLLNKENQWRMAPVYDLTPSEGINGEQTCMVNNKGKDITEKDFLAAAATVDVDARTVREIIQQVDAALADMKK